MPRKNIRPLAGHPLVAYSIAAGLAARHVTRVIVSTDDPEIAAVSRAYGAEVPFLRPAELANDDSLDLPVFQHALTWLDAQEQYRPDLVIQLRPTSPLRPVGLIDDAIGALEREPPADCVRTVSMATQNPYKMWKAGPDGLIDPLLHLDGVNEPYNLPRQSLPEVLWQTGHVDVIRPASVMSGQSLTGTRVRPLRVDRSYCVDIDNESDWRYAEWLLSQAPSLPITMPKPATGPTAGRRPLPEPVSLLIIDFDGVMTDNRVWVREDGIESVACDRSDGLGLEQLRTSGIEAIVLSKEVNPVVAARCRKLAIACRQGIDDKASELRRLAADRGVPPDHIVFVGNDVNDLECMELAGCGVAVADAHPAALAKADLVLSRPGGRGAVREICDRIAGASRTR